MKLVPPSTPPTDSPTHAGHLRPVPSPNPGPNPAPTPNPGPTVSPTPRLGTPTTSPAPATPATAPAPPSPAIGGTTSPTTAAPATATPTTATPTTTPTTRPIPDPTALAALLDLQHGLVARHQVLACGYTSAQIRRRLRRNEWARVHPGVFINHTGPLTWRQKAWAAVLSAWPAALAGESAWRAAGGPGRFTDDAPIVVAVDRQRHLVPVRGVVLRRTSRLPSRTTWNTSPPRMRFEEVALDLAESSTTETTAIGWLADAVQARLTTADRLLAAAQARPRMARRHFLAAVIGDARDGACSVLEQAYAHRVERRHGLPTPARQSPTGVGRPGFRDVEYPTYGLIIELDGRLGHTRSTDRSRGLARDLEAAAARDSVTLRLGWAQVSDSPCRTARLIAAVLRRRGWGGSLTPCAACRLAARPVNAVDP